MKRSCKYSFFCSQKLQFDIPKGGDLFPLKRKRSQCFPWMFQVWESRDVAMSFLESHLVLESHVLRREF